MSTILKTKIIDGFKNNQWDTSNPENNSIKNIEVLVDSIIDYINTEHNITALTNGSYITPPSIPNPIVNESLKSTLYTSLKTRDSFIEIWEGLVYNGIPENAIRRMFQCISIWLTSPPYQVTLNVNSPITGFITSIIPPDLPLVPVLFPSMVYQGIICENEILSKSFSNNSDEAIEQLWIIVSKYIQNGLNSNVIVPIPTGGLVNTFPYMGITNITLSFN